MRRDAALLVVLAALLTACSDRGASTAPVASKAPPIDERVRCEKQRDEVMQQAGELLAQNRARSALPILAACSGYLRDSDFQKLFDSVRAGVARLDLEDVPIDQKINRHRLLQQWKSYAGELPDTYEKELRKLDGDFVRSKQLADTASAEIRRMDFWALCTEAGRILRTPENKRTQPRTDAILSEAGFSSQEKLAISNREVVLGMDECALAAALGKPESVNRSVGSYGRHDQWVYRRGGYAYVYTEDGKVRSYQQ